MFLTSLLGSRVYFAPKLYYINSPFCSLVLNQIVKVSKFLIMFKLFFQSLFIITSPQPILVQREKNNGIINLGHKKIYQKLIDFIIIKKPKRSNFETAFKKQSLNYFCFHFVIIEKDFLGFKKQ